MKNHVLALACAAAFSGAAHGGEIIGYYPGWKSAAFPVTAANVDASRLSTVLYAFLDVCWNGRHGNPNPEAGIVADCSGANGSLVLRDEAQDGANLRALVALKEQHPRFKVMVSVGGWHWSNQFSNVADNAATRAQFVASSLALLRKYGLDGVDIDWEYPGQIGVACTAGQVCDRPADKRNFITLSRELRSALDAAGKQDRKHYHITIAAGGSASYSDGGWLKELSQSLDWINIMSYDYHMPWEHLSAHHSALQGDLSDPENGKGMYAAATVERYLAQGVAPDKLVLGVPFYGYGWKGCPAGAAGDGQYQQCAGAADGGNDGGASYGYSHLLQQGLLDGGKGYVRHWNAAAKAPYLYNPQTQVWISYEDPQSVREKVRYIKARHLRGAMFWELSADTSQQLLQALAGK